ncbi:MAG TPA: hypothetical protein EYG40_02425 [Verrucomicrobia bacterium]|nr:hypothetical protein [Verrucomicrobiales bacterium]HIL53874.1 hypothetical protein [Verrucomicrobiota bacterium]
MLALGDKGATIALASIIVMLAVIFILFHSLTVRISPSDISLSFGIGLIRKNFSIADICRVKVVRNRWYNGFGIKKIRSGWLYNVSGLDAIEIQLKNERKYRIGTDQPKELLVAVESVLKGQN